VYQQNDVKKGLQHSKDALLELLNSDGVAIISNGTIETKGKVPERDDIEDLVLWLQTQEHGTLYQQPNLSSVYEPAVSYATEASGLLALTIQQDKGIYILAFRPEEIEEVAWGGNPADAVHFENDGIRYHPRASFDIWKQAVRQTAIPWNNDERLVAEQLRNFIVDFTLRKT
jgi:light-regulated signal transduction histidine kinase (bacteriophytochrome)